MKQIIVTGAYFDALGKIQSILALAFTTAII